MTTDGGAWPLATTLGAASVRVLPRSLVMTPSRCSPPGPPFERFLSRWEADVAGTAPVAKVG
ncbi:MAG: hypothetical protein QG597_1762 [Actinomycetota bacterium]|nr:hypothetical protein [Actinomycetota bacterium]